jgi:hypothetical protein
MINFLPITHSELIRRSNAPRVNYGKNPGYCNNLYTTRRRRADEYGLAHAVVTGADPDSLLWLSNNHPLECY